MAEQCAKRRRRLWFWGSNSNWNKRYFCDACSLSIPLFLKLWEQSPFGLAVSRSTVIDHWVYLLWSCASISTRTFFNWIKSEWFSFHTTTTFIYTTFWISLHYFHHPTCQNWKLSNLLLYIVIQFAERKKISFIFTPTLFSFS